MPSPPLDHLSPPPPPHRTSHPLLFPPHHHHHHNNNNNNNYYFNHHHQAFPQNPNPNPNYYFQGQQQQQIINDEGVFDYLSKLGLIHTNHHQQDPDLMPLNNNNKQQQQQLVFGSLLHSDSSKQQQQQQQGERELGSSSSSSRHNGGDGGGGSQQMRMRRNAAAAAAAADMQKNVQVSSLAFGNYVSTTAAAAETTSSQQQQQQQRWRMLPPPGFSMTPPGNKQHHSNSSSIMMDKGKGNLANSGGGQRLHIDARESLVVVGHSLPDVQDLHDMNQTNIPVVESLELDDLQQQVQNLLLQQQDGTTDHHNNNNNNHDDDDDVNKGPKSRDKDYRSDKRGQWLLNQRMRNHRSRTECRGDINRLNISFLQLYQSLIPPEEEKEKQKQLMALLNRHVTKEWPGARLFLYGSCANSFGFSKSDIDVCLAMGDAEVDKSEILLKLADILKSDNLQNVQALTRARVPIVKLMDPVTGISCDICVNNLLAVINTKLLRDYSKIDVRLRQLAFIVKHWAKSRGVNETYQGTLSSYAYVLMCIHFLQQRTPSILPCLQGMERTYKVDVDNVECSYFDQVDKLQGFGSRNNESIAQLVWAFFSYWAYCHDYTNDVISIRTGSLISKREKDWTRRMGNDRHLICIEDPFEVSHDLGRVVDKHSIRVLREEFERAAEILQYDPNPCVKLFEPYVPS
ncbi:hypothetical protein SSX86_021564 [Deinandra increscens subsp. villosa]|uniref:RNA uridylyltransferase n=1 Tax=Deinandra increscens subsp. villosa TaxID=3103831 RepID=A0AAP0GSH3_9ASTR